MFRVFRSEWYEKKFEKLDKKEQNVVKKFELKLKENPYSGKPLGYDFFREKKFNGKRLLFLVYPDYKVVFLVSITDKKGQKHEISLVKIKLDFYKSVVEELLKKI